MKKKNTEFLIGKNKKVFEKINQNDSILSWKNLKSIHSDFLIRFDHAPILICP